MSVNFRFYGEQSIIERAASLIHFLRHTSTTGADKLVCFSTYAICSAVFLFFFTIWPPVDGNFMPEFAGFGCNGFYVKLI